jgi:hypothetical protein
MKLKIISVFTLILAAVMVINAENTVSSLSNSISYCLGTVIPSLFGFTAVSTFLIKIKGYRIIFKPLHFLLGRILKLDEEGFAILILSITGGYPVGAKLLSESGRRDAADLLPFCYCGSAMFISAVAGSVLSSYKTGFIVYLSNALACVTFVILTGKSRIYPHNPQARETNSENPRQPMYVILTESVLTTAKAMLNVCAMIIAFSLIIETLNYFGVNSAVLMSILEITNVRNIGNIPFLIPVTAFLFSFGGACVVLQVAALVSGKIPLRKFVLYRIPVGLVGAFYACILTEVFAGKETAVMSSAAPFTFSEARNPVAGVMLVVMSLILTVFSMSGSKANPEQKQKNLT